MMADSLTTPIALLVFRRPATTAHVFEMIRQVRPDRLLVVADGPRPGVAGEAECCAAVHEIVETVDWPCFVQYNYAANNMGLRARVISGISWVFEQVEEAIVLEDDCLPDATFFWFCQELLARYRADTRVAMISGNNFQDGQQRGPASYYFSVFSHIWGWATWRRAWQCFDPLLDQWPALRRRHGLDSWLLDSETTAYWTEVFDFIYRRGALFNNWDYQWLFSCWAQSGLTILPNVNLVSNIGFGASANSGITSSELGEIPRQSIEFPLTHPESVTVDREADRYTQASVFRKTTRSPWNRRKDQIFEVMPDHWRRIYREWKLRMRS